MNLFVALASLGIWFGATLVFQSLPMFHKWSLEKRLIPFVHRSGVRGADRQLTALEGVTAALAPLANTVGARISKLVGLNDEIAQRLDRSGRNPDVAAFRLQQLIGGLVSSATMAMLATAGAAPLFVTLAVAVGGFVMAFLVAEQRVVTQSEAFQQRIESELPIIVEQFGMLLSSGYSLSATINRIAQRGNGISADELEVCANRIRQGVSEVDALREWAERCDVSALHRIVSVLALNWEAADLGQLISGEARTIRHDLARAQLEVMDKRAQQVWIPVTVATLLPGVIFMAVPFVQAMNQLTGS